MPNQRIESKVRKTPQKRTEETQMQRPSYGESSFAREQNSHSTNAAQRFADAFARGGAVHVQKHLARLTELTPAR
jgi:hypothetical protein